MLAIVGGSGRLPDILCEAEPSALRWAPVGTQFGTGTHPARDFRYERLGVLVDDLREAGVDRVAFAGALRRPRLDFGALDDFTRDALMQIGPALSDGDDAVLRGVVSVFERAGFGVVSADDIVPALLPTPGILTCRGPEDQDISDADRARILLDTIGSLDIGQASVVAGGQVLAIEAFGGTDWMLKTLAGDLPGRPSGGVLWKAPKPDQDRRIDLPAIGPGTVRAAQAAGLRGIAIDAGGVLLIDRDMAVAAADKAGLFIWVREQ